MSSGLFCASAHFANPDALLNVFALLTLFFFWNSFARARRAWSVAGGMSAGLAVLAKGPVGLVLPFSVILLFLLWSRKSRLLWDRRLLWAALAFALVALPWYVWVGVETKVAFLQAFIMKHNVGRFLQPMEHHGGPLYYYLGVLAVGFAPWSAFLALASWYATARRACEDTEFASFRVDATIRDRALSAVAPNDAYRLLWCWVAVYFVFFSLAGTKLPNYILPVYTPLAIMTARFLERWRSGDIQPAVWLLRLSVACLAFIGVATSFALLAAGGNISLPALHSVRLAELGPGAVLGAVPVLGAAAAWRCLSSRQRSGLLVYVTASSVVFTGGLFAWGTVALDSYKAPRALVQAANVQQTNNDIRVACYRYFQPSLVFYCRREVQHLESEQQVLEFLRCPLPAYLFVPATVWEELKTSVSGPHHLLARHGDLYKRCEVVVVGNR
jgi:4-amino-4-deoxy-L-arabinose transferase-like glycosyltransferase